MKRIWQLFLGISLLFFTSCFDILEEVHLQKNGSGKYLLTMDMSGILSDPFMKEAIGEAMKSEGSKAGIDFMDMDTSFTFGSAPEARALSAADQKLLDQVVVNMIGNEDKGELKMGLTVNFNSLEEMETISNVMKKVSEKQEEGAGASPMFGGGQFSEFGNLFSMKKKKLFARSAAPPLEGLLDEETKGMMSMLLSASTYKTIYHMPGKVKNTTIPNAEIAGKVVTVENLMLDILDQKVKLDGEIKFK